MYNSVVMLEQMGIHNKCSTEEGGRSLPCVLSLIRHCLDVSLPMKAIMW